ncbi:MAG: hypothetical protein HQ579_02775 [Candidatus Omnitrophica bacterium]|nr:hypothetical protein [Candidatus Omnitrophota bacterium]
MKNVSNKNAGWSVEHCEAFKGSNTYGQHEHNGVYKAYSYGSHFPIYAFKEGRWYRNTDKYSPSTSKHQGQLKPFASEFIGLDTAGMKAL